MSQPVYLELISPLYVGGNLINDDKNNKKDFMFSQIILHFQFSGNYFLPSFLKYKCFALFFFLEIINFIIYFFINQIINKL